jgi:NAD(P)H-hydrate epimerase
VNLDRVSAAKEISQSYKAVTVLKGAGSLIVDGDQLNLCTAGNPGMAVAGMGDVLSGVIGSLLGQGYSERDAASMGVWVHACGADKLAEQQGEIGMLALDTIPFIRQQLNRLAER